MKDLETKWAIRLLKEHKEICWQHGINLTTPVINISSGKQTDGYWSPRHRTISISRHLIKTEPWDIVLEVLKHEMAHQYVTDFYNDADKHGNYFRKACKKLGVHPAFVTNKDYAAKLEDFKGRLPSDAKRMLTKVEKLMALGQSSNEAEAQAASRKANYLLNKYNLQRIENDSPEIKYHTICHKKKRIESIQQAILSILQKYYYVSCISSHTYDFQDDAEYRSVVIVGKKEAIKVAEYVYHFLFDTAQTLWQEYRKKHKAGRGDKVSFDMGFIKGIENNHEKMLESSQIELNDDRLLPVSTVKALVEQNRIKNQVEVSRIFPKLIKQYYGKHRPSSSAYKKGFKNGKNTHIKKGVTTRGGGISGFLGSSGKG